MDAGIFGLLGTAIGALASFGGTYISNQYALKKEREREANNVELNPRSGSANKFRTLCCKQPQ